VASPKDIPGDILVFLLERIDDVPQLEALLLMSESPGRGWSLEEVASRTYTRTPAARGAIESLQRRGLVAAVESQGYVLQTNDPSDIALVARVADFYRANLVRVATLIHEKAPASVQEFARAFEFKKDH
jgi:hypothetical protein